jgi:putative ABC transport system permease protein
MSFILNLTKREIRSSWRRLLFFFLCIALGVGSVVALRSLIINLNRVVGDDARALLTADIEVSSTNDFTPSEIGIVEEVIGASSIVDARDEAITTPSMARFETSTGVEIKFVDLKGVEPSFPLVGDFRLSDGTPFNYKQIENGGALLVSTLLEETGARVGDKVRIGEQAFEIRGTFNEEPGGSSGFRLGSRVFIEKRAFDEAGITRNTSRVRRRILYRTTDDPTPLAKELRARLRGTTVQVNSYREQQENISEQFARTENYLSLTGLLILVLGGIGIWNVSRAFVEQKRRSVAVLKCLGASGGRVLSVYILQILILGTLGSIAGVGLAQIGLWLGAWRFADVLPDKMSYAVGLSTSLQGIALGIIISTLFSLLPLMQIRSIKPRLLLRDENNANLRRLDWKGIVIATLCLLALLGIAIWQAGSPQVGGIFLGGLAAAGLVLFGAASVLLWILKRLKRLRSLTLRQAINSLSRPGNQTRVVMLAVGLGVFVVLSVQMVQSSLLREFDLTQNSRLPSLIFADIQKSQIDGVASTIEQRLGEAPEKIPTVRARIAAVNGEPIDLQQPQMRQQQGQIGREFAITYRADLEANETVINGEWWPAERSEKAEVSVEDRFASRINVRPGDEITFDISGRKITAEVTSVRKIDLRNTRTAFVFVFRPGVLEKAPQTFASTVVGQIPATDRQKLQRDLVEQFPNIQIFDVADIITTVNRLVGNFVIAVSFVGSFVLLSGILILIGAVALTKSQRIYENAILKTLGAKRKLLTGILVSEYIILGSLAGLIGSAFAAAMSYAACTYILNIDWSPEPLMVIIGIVATALIVLTVGLLASFDVLFRKPLATLRSQ